MRQPLTTLKTTSIIYTPKSSVLSGALRENVFWGNQSSQQGKERLLCGAQLKEAPLESDTKLAQTKRPRNCLTDALFTRLELKKGSYVPAVISLVATEPLIENKNTRKPVELAQCCNIRRGLLYCRLLAGRFPLSLAVFWFGLTLSNIRGEVILATYSIYK